MNTSHINRENTEDNNHVTDLTEYANKSGWTLLQIGLQ
jgi:hypothetical protein